MTENARGVLEMSSAMLISGTIGWFVIAAEESVANIGFWRCAFGAATLALICAWRGFLRRNVMSVRQLIIAVLGGLAIVSNWLLLFAAYSRASISVATVVYNIQPFMLMALGAVFLKEHISAQKLAWIGVSFLGVLLLASARPDAAYVSASYGPGIALALAAAACYAIATILAKPLKGVPPHLIALIHVGVGMIMLAPFVSFGAPSGASMPWAMLITIGVVHTGVVYILLYGAFQKLPTPTIGALSFIYPIATIAVDRVAFGHRLQLAQLIGAAAILIGAAGAMLGWNLLRRRDATVRP